MKIFALSLLLPILIIALVVANSIYVNRTINTLTELARTLKQDRTAVSAEKLLSYWESHRAFIALSVSLREIDSTTENIICFKSACANNNDWLIEQSYSLLCNSLDDIRRYEKISLLNIL
ncbi:MAG: hypothetical protein J6U86_05010 [Clostridia bacterium]|nr:hypothetical protein [Clostridia bacterium]